jgi:hypothetical protein
LASGLIAHPVEVVADGSLSSSDAEKSSPAALPRSIDKAEAAAISCLSASRAGRGDPRCTSEERFRRKDS